MTRATELPPGVWKCHGYHLAARASCPKCGYRRAEELPPMTSVNIWQCCGRFLPITENCPKCGRCRFAQAPGLPSATNSRDIDTANTVKTRVKAQSGGRGILKRCSSKGKKKRDDVYDSDAEARFAQWVLTWPNRPVYVQPHPKPIKLSDGQEFRVDFLLIFDGGTYQYAEVKGGYKGPGWEQGHERYKRARAEHPMVRFGMYEWTGKEWVAK